MAAPAPTAIPARDPIPGAMPFRTLLNLPKMPLARSCADRITESVYSPATSSPSPPVYLSQLVQPVVNGLLFDAFDFPSRLDHQPVLEHVPVRSRFAFAAAAERLPQFLVDNFPGRFFARVQLAFVGPLTPSKKA